MARFMIAGIAGVLLATPMLAAAEAFDGSKPLLCASVEVMQCVPGNGCESVSADAIDAPQFFRLNVAENRITGSRAGGTELNTSIERTETVDGKLILQGAEEGREGVRDGLGWTLSVAQDTGRMVLSASGDDAAFVIFGNCLAL